MKQQHRPFVGARLATPVGYDKIANRTGVRACTMAVQTNAQIGCARRGDCRGQRAGWQL
jgi:hypothetical protein